MSTVSEDSRDDRDGEQRIQGGEEVLESDPGSRLKLSGPRTPISFCTATPELECVLIYVFSNIFIRSHPCASTMWMMLG